MSNRLRLTKVQRNPTIGNYFLSQTAHDFVSSGCTLLDCCLGGGWPLGRIVNLVGDKSTGKTLLAIEATANFLRKFADQNGGAYYLEAEAAFDKRYAAALGLPIDKVTFIENVDTVEGFYKELLKVTSAHKKRPAIFIVDSLDGLSDEAEKGRELDKATYGGDKAKMLSKIFRKSARAVERSSVLVFIISQTRDKIGVIFGDRHTRSGGKALDFYASQIVWLHEMGKLTKTVAKVKRAYGVTVKAKVKKNKVGLPYRECQFDVLFGYGVDSISSSLQWLATVGMLNLVSSKLTKLNISSYIKHLDKLSAREYRHKVSKIEAATRLAWTKIEEKFLPKRTKYR